MIITDVPLENHVRVLPPLKSPAPLFEYRPNSGILLGMDAFDPQEYTDRLVDGCMGWTRFDRRLAGSVQGILSPDRRRISARVDRVLGTNVGMWNAYIPTVGHGHGTDPETLMYVYRYLGGYGGTIVLCNQRHMPLLDDEVPVARIDISRRGPGDTPVKNADNILGDGAYIFTRSDPTTVHNTRILDRMGTDPVHPDRWFLHIPMDGIDLEGLMDACGDSVRFVSVYGRETMVGTSRHGNTSHEPLEVVDLRIDDPGIPPWERSSRCCGASGYTGCRIVGYFLYMGCSDSRLHTMGMAGAGTSPGTFGLAVIVDM